MNHFIDANSAYSDTRIWKIDHSHLKLQYTASLITASFVTSSLPYLLGTAMEGKMILIGLGGGSLNSFLATRFPKVGFLSFH